MSKLLPPLPDQAQRGFTLIELIVVIGIVAILTSFALPSMRETIAKWQISNAVNTFTASLQLARSEAVRRSRFVRMCRSTNGTSCSTQSDNATRGWMGGWIVYVDNDSSGATFNSGDEIILVQNSITNMDSTQTDDTSPNPFAFTPYGILQAGQGAQGLNFVWDSDGKFARGLCISFSGRFRLVDHNSSCKTKGQG